MTVCYHYAIILFVRRKTFVVDDDIQAAIDDLRRRYKLSKEADAIRLALMIVSASPTLSVPPDFLPAYKPGRRKSTTTK